MERAYLLLGTNLGNLKENLRNALELLQRNGLRILKSSRIYKTKPWGKTDQPDFLNMAVEVETSLSPRELLKIVKHIEKEMKRDTEEKWGPRIIDIDILFYENIVINEPDLVIPHPYFFKRNFALIPMAEIAPDFVPPLQNKSIKDLTAGVESEGIEIYCD
ncbi:MAG: 2-amino-4-hydroxy-6-hydroxymethyldihydropteridine diphosphokinase [candidate division WOR-3 bacterium]|nr:2-amino-4-hydroxy-6-hydroxymethyldihydropteridine diphosphokinase [candidate division WOR-3 bacterium]